MLSKLMEMIKIVISILSIVKLVDWLLVLGGGVMGVVMGNWNLWK